MPPRKPQSFIETIDPTHSVYGDAHAFTSDQRLATHALHLHDLGIIDDTMVTELSQPRKDVKEVEVKYTKEYLAMHPEYTGEDAHKLVSLEEAERRQRVRDGEMEGLNGRWRRGKVDEWGNVSRGGSGGVDEMEVDEMDVDEADEDGDEGTEDGEVRRPMQDEIMYGRELVAVTPKESCTQGGEEDEEGTSNQTQNSEDIAPENEDESDCLDEGMGLTISKSREEARTKSSTAIDQGKDKGTAIATTESQRERSIFTIGRDQHRNETVVDWDAILERTGGARDLEYAGEDDEAIEAEIRRLVAQHARQTSLSTRRLDTAPDSSALATGNEARVVIDLETSDEDMEDLREGQGAADMQPCASSNPRMPSRSILHTTAEPKQAMPRTRQTSRLHHRFDSRGEEMGRNLGTQTATPTQLQPPTQATIAHTPPFATPPQSISSSGFNYGPMGPALPGFPESSRWVATHAPPSNPEIFYPMFYDARRPYVPSTKDARRYGGISAFHPHQVASIAPTRHLIPTLDAAIQPVAPPPRGYFGEMPAAPPLNLSTSTGALRGTGATPAAQPTNLTPTFPAMQQSRPPILLTIPPPPAPPSTPPPIPAPHPSSATPLPPDYDIEPFSPETPPTPLPGESDYTFLTTRALLSRLCFHRRLSIDGSLHDMRHRLIRWDTRRRLDPTKNYPPKYEQWEYEITQALMQDERQDRTEFAVDEVGERRAEQEVDYMIWRKRRGVLGEIRKRDERRRVEELLRRRERERER